MSPTRVTSPDAVVVLPGIMGSRLRDRATGDLLWGLDLKWYASAWLRSGPWRRLALDDDERAGSYGRVVADSLLDVGCLAPVLGGFEPYGDLVRGLRPVLAAPEAILEFAYDWRLPVTYNASLLAEAMPAHLARWRATETAKRAEEQAGRPAQLVVVAHSMGGLVYRALVGSPELVSTAADVRAVLTLGTPFSGAAKALLPLSEGEGAPFPLPHGRMRTLSRTLPGLYDLLPLYRCIENGADVRAVTADDVVAIGGARDLAEAALTSGSALRSVPLGRVGSRHWCYVGGFQPTPSSATIADGTASVHDHTFAVDASGGILLDNGAPRRVLRYGDSTVPLASAQIPGGDGSIVIAQQHGRLARVSEAVAQAKAILLRDTDSPPIPLGDTEIGFVTPDFVVPETDHWVPIVGAEIGQVSCLVDSADGVSFHAEKLRPTRRGETVGVDLRLPEPGVFRVTMETGGGQPISRLVVAADPGLDEG